MVTGLFCPLSHGIRVAMQHADDINVFDAGRRNILQCRFQTVVVKGPGNGSCSDLHFVPEWFRVTSGSANRSFPRVAFIGRKSRRQTKVNTDMHAMVDL
jgi:hypothetical protein